MSIWDIRPEQKVIARQLSNSLDLQLIEEMSELTQILLKRRRYYGEGQPVEDSMHELDEKTYEEFVDVICLIKEYIWWEEMIPECLASVEDFKLTRTMERLGIEKGEGI